MRINNFGKIVLLAVIIAAITGVFSSDVYSQKSRRRATPKPTPTPMLTGAEIISRAGDLVDTQAVAPSPKTTAQPETTAAKVKDLSTRVKRLEADKADAYEQKQKRVLMNLDILTRAEQRSESLRKQLFDMMEKESAVKTKLDQIEEDIRPEVIERRVQFAGSMHPEDVREMRRKSLDAERRNLQQLLTDIQSTRSTLAANLEKADSLVDRLRTKLEKEIDDSFLKDEPN